MECPTCGYDNMDAVADGDTVKRTCPVCDGGVMDKLNLTRDQVVKESHECNPNSVLDEYTKDWLAMYDLLYSMTHQTGVTTYSIQDHWNKKIRALIGGERC